MISVRRAALAAALFAVSGCAGAGASLDRMADQVDARSTCHTSSGEWVRSPSCTISYSVAKTISSSTTTTTAVEAAPASGATQAPVENQDD